MNSAIYGRMRIGKCLELEQGELFSRNKNDPKYLGCFDDVIQIMDNRCSGKNTCEVRLTFDNDLQKVTPCHQGLKNYLEASYNCLAGKLFFYN